MSGEKIVNAIFRLSDANDLISMLLLSSSLFFANPAEAAPTMNIDIIMGVPKGDSAC